MSVASKASLGRPRQFDEGDVLSAMMNVFWRKGYEGTSLSDLVEATGLLRGSLYAAFGSKDEMYARALAHYHSEMVAVGADALDASEDPEAALRSFMLVPIEDDSGSGCFLCNASADRADTDEKTSRQVQRSFKRLHTALSALVSRARPSMSDADVDARASLLLVTYAGLRILSRTRQDRDMMTKAAEAALDF